VSDSVFVVVNENSSQLKQSFLINFWVPLDPNKNIIWSPKKGNEYFLLLFLSDKSSTLNVNNYCQSQKLCVMG
jgi:hypothetical protein